MVEFVRRDGGQMWVADNRVEEYKAAGFVPAAKPLAGKPAPAPKPEAEKPAKTEEKKQSPKKETAQKTSVKK